MPAIPSNWNFPTLDSLCPRILRRGPVQRLGSCSGNFARQDAHDSLVDYTARQRAPRSLTWDCCKISEDSEVGLLPTSREWFSALPRVALLVNHTIATRFG